LLQPGTLPEKVRLSFNGTVYECELGESVRYTEEDYERHRNWHLERKDDPSPRHALFRMIVSKLSTLSGTEKRKVLDDLLSWSGAAPEARSSHSTLTTEALKLLNKGDLLEVGAHTMTHPMLSSLQVAEQRNEIKQSKDWLEAIIEAPVTSFAYPHGSFMRETVAIVREAGFSVACSTESAAVGRGDDLFRLPRIGIRNLDGEAFSRLLRWWLGR
jgi:peptidoglycan/xylan/chitin deacetylase (PgdA/CDA1 family)